MKTVRLDLKLYRTLFNLSKLHPSCPSCKGSPAMFVKNIDTLDETARTIVVGEPKTQMTKLPFWSSVAEAYRSTFRNLGVLFRISWAWIFLVLG